MGQPCRSIVVEVTSQSIGGVSQTPCQQLRVKHFFKLFIYYCASTISINAKVINTSETKKIDYLALNLTFSN